MSRSRLGAVVIAATAFVGCAGGAPRSDYERCVADQRGRAPGARIHRLGWYSRELALAFDVGRPPPDTPLVVREMAGACAGYVSVRTPTRSYANGPFTHVDVYRTTLDGTRLAYIGSLGGAVHVVVDGAMSSPYRTIHQLAFSRNGAHFGYLAQDGAEIVLVIDGKERRRFARASTEIFALLDDGRALVAVGEPSGGFRVHVGDAAGPLFDTIGWRSVILSERGGRHAYVGYRGNVARTVVDGRELDAPGADDRVAFSEDGQHYAFFARSGSSATVVIDGVVHRAGPTSSLLLVEGGKHVVTRGTDETGVERWELVGARTPLARPSSDDYRPRGGAKGQRMVLGASIGPLFDELHFDTIHVHGDGSVSYEGSRDEVRVRVVDNVIR